MASNLTTNTAQGLAGQNGAHTPGPWEIEPKHEGSRGHWLRTADGELLALACKMDSEATELANARLIAAAPHMLEALRQARFGLETTEICLRSWNNGLGGPADVDGILSAINSAIAAATGEAG